MDHRTDQLIAVLGRLAKNREERALIAAAIQALDDRYELSRKIAQEPRVEEIIKIPSRGGFVNFHARRLAIKTTESAT